MTITLRNKTKLMVNLGVAGGKMVVFAPDETQVLNDAVASAHAHNIERYVDGNFLEIVKVSKAKEVFVDNEQPEAVVEDVPVKPVRRKR